MKWTLKLCNIIDEPADVLICSANVLLDLSDGVAADLLGRYGSTMQEALHKITAARSPHYVSRGEVFPYTDGTLPYKAILHAVAVDSFYQSTPEVIENIVRSALQQAKGYQAKRVTLTALATGLGNLSLPEFASGVRPLMDENFSPVEEGCICLMEDYRLRELAKHLPKAIVISK